MDIFELLAQGLEQNIPKDYLLNIINYTKNIEKKSNQYVAVYKQQLKNAYKFASVGEASFDNENEIEQTEKEINANVLLDTSEYTAKEIAEALCLNYHKCMRLLKNSGVISLRREGKGKVFLGKDIKNVFAQGDNFA